MNTTSQLIKAERKKLGLSQSEVAEALGFSNVFMHRIESGMADLPAKHVEPLAKILKIDREDIMRALKKDMSDELDEKAK